MTQLAPFDVTQTWAEHFTEASASTLQDLITAGWTYYAQPAPATGTYSEEIDHGSVIAAGRIVVDLTWSALAGSPTVACTISTKETSGAAWSDQTGFAVFASTFRYVKVEIEFASTGDDVAIIDSLTTTIQAQTVTDSGTATATSTDAGGTQVNFAVNFGAVTALALTPASSSAVHATYDDLDADGFDVYLWDAGGSRVTGTVAWTATGYLAA